MDDTRAILERLRADIALASDLTKTDYQGEREVHAAQRRVDVAAPALVEALEAMLTYIAALRAEDGYYSKGFDCYSAADDIEYRIKSTLAPLGGGE